MRVRKQASPVRRWLWRLVLLAIGLPILPVVVFRWAPLPTSSVMLQERLAPATARHGRIQYRWTPWSRMAPAVRLAVVAAEDQKFPSHHGFDFESITDALEHPGPRGIHRGASTITQQVARNVFLWQGRSYLRKGLEAYFTVLLEVFWSKRRILEVYLNVAQFGEGIYGVGAASTAVFGKRAAALTGSEAAVLAAVLPNPLRLHAARPSAYVRERAAWIEEQMLLLGAGYLATL